MTVKDLFMIVKAMHSGQAVNIEGPVFREIVRWSQQKDDLFFIPNKDDIDSFINKTSENWGVEITRSLDPDYYCITKL